MKSTPILTAPLLQSSIFDEQRQIETEAIAKGVLRYNQMIEDSRIRGTAASLKPAERLLAYWFESMRDAVRDEQRACGTKQAAPGRGIYASVLRANDADELAVLAMHEMVSACIREPAGVHLTKLAYSIGRAVVAELGLAKLKSDNREAYDELNMKYRDLNPFRVNLWANKSLADPVWDRTVCAHVGVCLVWLAIGSCMVPDHDGEPTLGFRHANVKHGIKTIATVIISERAVEIIEDGHEVRRYLRPRYLPMIVPPLPWTYMDDNQTVQGGFLQIRTPFISKPTRSQKRALDAADLTQQFEALSAVSDTPFRINRRLLDVMKEVSKSGGGIGRVPPIDSAPKPPRPDTFESEQAERAWKREAVMVHRENVRRACNRIEFGAKIAVAEQFEHRAEMYFPHQLDFRGRTYPIPVHLNHQGDDVCRGLLEFADTETVDDRGRWWLKVHAANCWGLDKLPFKERVLWTDGNLTRIARVAKDPLADDWWTHADESRPGACDGKPWQFLAAAVALTDPDAGAHLPVQVDGTCNGLQHYAAMGRDPKGAASVNLCPSDRPNSVYLDVLEVVRREIERDAITDNVVVKHHKGKPVEVNMRTVAAAVLKILCKESVKQNVMTTVYGVTRVGARDQVLGHLKELGFKDQMLYDAADYLSGTTLKAMGNVCSAAKSIMDWLRARAKEIASAGHLVAWTSPLGLPVVQPYRNWRTRRVCTVLGDLTLQVEEDDVPVAVSEHVNGCAPNFVHCIDATHWYRTAVACRNQRMAIAGVHDCYWGHASRMDDLGVILRREFVAIHRSPLLDELRAEWEKRFSLSLPEPPPRGDFNLDDVMHAPYAFS